MSKNSFGVFVPKYAMIAPILKINSFRAKFRGLVVLTLHRSASYCQEDNSFSLKSIHRSYRIYIIAIQKIKNKLLTAE